MWMRTKKIVIAALAAFGLAIAGATAGVAASLPNVAMLKSLGKGEGKLNIIAVSYTHLTLPTIYSV